MRRMIAILMSFIFSLVAMFAFGMWTMWSWINPDHMEVWDDGTFYYVQTADGNIWLYDMEE